MGRQSNGWASVYRSAPRVYDKFAKAQDYRPLIELLDSMGGIKSKSILDVGTGTGKYAFLLSRHGAGEVVGIDKCGPMIGLARKIALRQGMSNLSFLEIDAAGLEFSSHFDSALSAWAINAPWDGDYESLDKGIDAILRSLRSGGRFYLVTTPPGEIAGELVVHLDGDYVKLHAETKARFITHLRSRWGFDQRTIRADWNFSSTDEAALCFGLLYTPQLAEAILERDMKTIRANATAMIAGK